MWDLCNLLWNWDIIMLLTSGPFQVRGWGIRWLAIVQPGMASVEVAKTASITPVCRLLLKRSWSFVACRRLLQLTSALDTEVNKSFWSICDYCLCLLFTSLSLPIPFFSSCFFTPLYAVLSACNTLACYPVYIFVAVLQYLARAPCLCGGPLDWTNS